MLGDVIEQLKKDLKKESESASKMEADLKIAVEEVKKRKQDVIQQGHDLTSFIQQSFITIKLECDKRETKLITQIKQLIDEKVATFDNQILSISAKVATLESQQVNVSR
jgi:hypothetical protein